MLYGLYISAAGLQSQEYRQNVTANNLANANTVGFKRDLAQAQARLNPARETSAFQSSDALLKQAPSGGVWSLPTGIDLSQSPLEQTNDPKDVALAGPGFFMIQGPSSEEKLLTRDGRFAINDTGHLTMASNGQQVLDIHENPIKLDPSKTFTISTHGEISQGAAPVAQLAVMNVANSGDLEKRGNSLLALKAGKSLQPTTVATQVLQGKIESSGVNPMIEMVSMLEGQRHFEANTKMIQYQDQTLQLLNSVGKVG